MLKFYLTILFTFSIVLIGFSQQFDWIIQKGGTHAENIAVFEMDMSGNFFIGGNCQDTCFFGADTIIPHGKNMYIAKYDSFANNLWVVEANGDSSLWAEAICVDSIGNTYIAGLFMDTMTIADTSLISFGGRDIFLIKFDPAGNLLLARCFGSNSSDDVHDLEVDDLGNIYLSGASISAIHFGDTTINNYGNWDMYLTKLDNNGVFEWSIRPDSSNISNGGRGLAKGPNGYIYVTGFLLGDVVWGTDTVRRDEGMFYLMKVETGSGNIIWVRNLGPPGLYGFLTKGPYVVEGKYGEVYVTYPDFPAPLNLEGTGLAKYDQNGNELWTQRFEGPGSSFVDALELDDHDNIFLSGSLRGKVGVGNQLLGPLSVPIGNNELLMVKADSSGGYKWALSYAGTTPAGFATVHALPLLREGVIAAGYFEDDLGLGLDTLVSKGFYDMLLLKLLYDPTNSLEGTVFEDTNGNGVQDGGEPPIIGQLIRVDSSGLFVSTDSNGYYKVYVEAGPHTLSLTNPAAGYFQTIPHAPQYYNIVFPGKNGSQTGVNFGLRNNTLTGKVFNDLNHDCVLDTSDKAMSNVTLLIQPGNLTTTTDAGGNYTIGLDSGHYFISQVIPPTTPHVQICPPPFLGYPIYIPSLSSSITNKNFANRDNTISGYVFEDPDSNCIFDADESPQVQRLIEILPGPTYATTNEQGYYKAGLDTGVYSVKQIPHSSNYWVQDCPVIPPDYTILVDSLQQTINGLDFGNNLIPGIHDLEVDLFSGPARPGFSQLYKITCTNLGSLPTDYTLTFKFDTTLGLVTPTGPFSYFDHDTIQWEVNDIFPGEVQQYVVLIQVPVDSALLGQNTHGIADIKTSQTDIYQLNNVDSAARIISGSYDPNNKEVDPVGYTTTGFISPNDSILTYTINFQNTGTDTAFSVVILDTLSPNIDVSTFRWLSSSHPMEYDISGQGIVAFTFDNILLPDSNTNEPSSHGFVRYSIQLDTGLVHGTPIQNTANIYFDFNPPVTTNTTLNTICTIQAVARFDWFPIAGGSVEFEQTAIYATSYIWDLGDGSVDSSANPTHLYDSTGNYLVCLTVTNECSQNTFCDTIAISLNSSHYSSKLPIKIFPNPNDGIFWINIPLEGFYNIRLYDVVGNLCFEKTYPSGQTAFPINIAHLPSGVYQVQVSGDRMHDVLHNLLILCK